MNPNKFLILMKRVFVCQFFAFFFLLATGSMLPAQVSSNVMTDFASSPINVTGGTVSPHVMINTSNDHQFFFKVYNDYSDLDDDGIPETTYKHSVDYYGYFDSSTCYDYKQPAFDVNGNSVVDADDKIFVPVSKTADKYCTGASSGYWSGNFLNWVTMARIDAIRKILFGGWRRLDSSANTVLERTYLPHDAHSWAKHYEGADLNKLTPFVSGVDYDNAAADPRDRGITFANTTDVDDANMHSQHVPDQIDGSFKWKKPDPPLMKVVKGNYSLWAGNERWQCTWSSNSPVGDNHAANNGNDSAVSGIDAWSSSPSYTDGIGDKEYIVRIQACVPGLETTGYCKKYPDGNLKPIGLFQRWGDNDTLLFGMMTGTYELHAVGGELASDIQSMRNEVNVDTDGTFKLTVNTIGGPIEYQKATSSLISRWCLYRIYGYDHADGTYNNGDNCSWGLSDPTDTAAKGRCTNWGNPFSEIYLQSLRYMAGLGIDGTFRANDSGYIRGLDTPTDWKNPLYECNSCARLNILNFSSSSGSYDYDNIDDNSNGPHTIFYDNTAKAGITLPGATDHSDHSVHMTDVVGRGEGIHGQKFFIGEADITEAAQTDDQLCTEKTVDSLGKAGGFCPEAPRLTGSFAVAGLAYYAHAFDIRPGDSDPQVDCGTGVGTTQGQRNLSGEQRVDTYGVAMATAVPTIDIPDPATGDIAATLIPACRNTSLNPEGNCAIVDFKIVSQDVAAGTGKFYVNWEDSEQGGDYDQDMWGVIEYVIDATSIKITTDTIADSTPNNMGFGYVISGTTDDGFHAHSGIRGFTSTEANVTSGSDCSSGCVIADGSSTATYTRGPSSAGLLKDPLWYAAKWGGFIDRDGNNLPYNDINGNGSLDPGEETPEEWDSTINATGGKGSDGIPDNYFYATNPQALENSINRVFMAILERTNSGTAAAVVANNLKGEGALYQAYYEPVRQDDLGNEVSWIGNLTSMWVDSAGFMREDGVGCVDPDDTDAILVKYCDGGTNNGAVCASPADCGGRNFKLDDYDTDLVIETFYDEVENRTRARIWTSTDPDEFLENTAVTVELNEIDVIWSAREQLSNLSDIFIADQRPLGDIASGGRHIFTWIDSGAASVPDGVVDSAEVVDFTKTAISANYGFFDVADQTSAEKIIDYIRGAEVAGFRPRLLDYDGDGTAEVQRLGDIINSTPSVVGAPREAFNLLYADTSYAPFVTKYSDRRNVIYVGGNDGMLHAFNGGYYVPSQASYSTFRPLPRKAWADRDVPEYYTVFTDAEYRTPHPLGSEMWAYVPKNLLPHLKWLTDNDYPHVYYVDGKPRIFDAQIFDEEVACTPTDKTAADCVHPNGWGTVMVVGMRMGGGPMTIDTAADGLGGTNAADDRTLSSAYIIFDITDSENPVLMAEFPLPDQSYAFVYPTVLSVKDRVEVNDSNIWHLVFGTGPDNLQAVDSSSTAKFYLLDLVELAASGSLNIRTYDTGVANSFMGSPTSVDWDLDYKSDGIYFGLVDWETLKVGPDTNKYVNGQLMRFGVDEDDDPNNWTAPQTVIDMNQPLDSAVTLGIDDLGERWVYFATGRFLSPFDRDNSNPTNKTSVQTQSIYGLKVCYDNDTTVCPTKSTPITLLYNEADGDDVWDDRIFNADILDVTNAELYYDFSLRDAPFGFTNHPALETDIELNRRGWVLDLPPIQGVEGVATATRAVGQPALLGGVLYTSVYQPSVSPCSGEGFSRLYGLYYKTGLGWPEVFSADWSDTNIDGEARARKFENSGKGIGTGASLHSGRGTGSRGVSVFTQLSTGTISRKESKTDDDIRSGKQSWRLRK